MFSIEQEWSHSFRKYFLKPFCFVDTENIELNKTDIVLTLMVLVDTKMYGYNHIFDKRAEGNV